MSASEELKRIIGAGKLSDVAQVQVFTISEDPFIGVGFSPDSELGLMFFLPSQTLSRPVKTARLKGRIDIPFSGVFSDGSIRELRADCLQFDAITPAVEVLLDALEDSIRDSSSATTAELTNDFVELFLPGKNLSESELTGLWGELVVLNLMSDPGTGVDIWHERLDSRYDFAVESFRLEVKTTLGTNRTHSFSSSQLPPDEGVEVWVCSVLAEHTFGGESVSSVWATLRNKLQNANTLKKLDSLVLSIVKRDPIYAESTTFDLSQSENSIRFLPARHVPTMITVPGVVAARWTCVLDDVNLTTMENIAGAQMLVKLFNR